MALNELKMMGKRKSAAVAVLFGAMGISALGAATVPAYAAGGSGESAQSMQAAHQVTMTWISGYHRYATIDGGLYTIGNTLPDGARVVAIQKGSVTLLEDGRREKVKMVNTPPDESSAAGLNNTLTPLTYVDDTIAQLDRAIAARSGVPGTQAQVKELRRLRDRLDAARDRLARNDLTAQEKEQLKSQISQDWLEAQQTLDALRNRILDSGKGGLSIDQLRATQNVLEDSTLEALRQPLAQLQKEPDLQAPMKNKSTNLLDAVTALLGSYPDYQALADKLDQILKDQKK